MFFFIVDFILKMEFVCKVWENFFSLLEQSFLGGVGLGIQFLFFVGVFSGVNYSFFGGVFMLFMFVVFVVFFVFMLGSYFLFLYLDGYVFVSQFWFVF